MRDLQKTQLFNVTLLFRCVLLIQRFVDLFSSWANICSKSAKKRHLMHTVLVPSLLKILLSKMKFNKMFYQLLLLLILEASMCQITQEVDFYEEKKKLYQNERLLTVTVLQDQIKMLNPSKASKIKTLKSLLFVVTHRSSQRFSQNLSGHRKGLILLSVWLEL